MKRDEDPRINTGSLVGGQFGLLKPLKLRTKRVGKHVFYDCLCEGCGRTVPIRGYNLSTGKTRSCGDYACRSKLMPQRGLTNQNRSTYMAWHVICRSPANVSRAWQGNFQAFLADMGPRPDSTYLEKIDERRLYEPGNCRWGAGGRSRTAAR